LCLMITLTLILTLNIPHNANPNQPSRHIKGNLYVVREWDRNLEGPTSKT